MITSEQRRNILIAIIVGFLLAILIALYFLLRRPAAPEPAIPADTQVQDVVDTTSSVPVRPPVTPAQAGAQTVTRNFVERFGTYSTDVAFTNIAEVQELVTPEYYAALQGQVYSLPEGTEYQGRTTRAISVEVVGGSEVSGTLTFSVTVQHELTTADRSSSSLEYQTATVRVEQRGSVWLVSSFAWQ